MWNTDKPHGDCPWSPESLAKEEEIRAKAAEIQARYRLLWSDFGGPS
jgi:hypothetical protein